MEWYADTPNQWPKLKFWGIDPPTVVPEEPTESIVTQNIDHSEQVYVPGDSPPAQSVPATVKPPAGLEQALISILWFNGVGKCIVEIIICAAGLLAVWATLPDSIKERILERFWPGRERKPPKRKI